MYNENEMILDMDDFDFNSIDGDDMSWVDDEHEAPADDKEYSPFDDDEEFSDEEDDFEPKEGEDEDSLAALNGDLTLLDDDFELSLGDEKMTKGELVARLGKVEEASRRSEELTTYFNNFKAIDDQMNAQFVASATENDIKLNNIRQRMADPGLTDAQRGQYYSELQKLEGNKRVLDERVNQYFQQREVREQQAEMVKLSQTNAVMTEKYGQKWVDTIAPAVTQYISESGVASPEMRKAISPQLLEVMIKAMKYDKMEKSGKEKVKAAAKKPTAAPKSTSSNTQRKPGATMSRREAQYRKAMREGDMTTLFNFIKD